MNESDIDAALRSVAALRNRLRQRLLRYVLAQPRGVSRDEAAKSLKISRASAAFHLDKLAEVGLLETSYRRVSGLGGPGAGRPSKLYTGSGRGIQVSYPPRSYELAALVLDQTLRKESPLRGGRWRRPARELGTRLARQSLHRADQAGHERDALGVLEQFLAENGYEPARDSSGSVVLKNCPFDALVGNCPDLMCHLNLALLQGVVAGLQLPDVKPVLECQSNMCCVAFVPQAA